MNEFKKIAFMSMMAVVCFYCASLLMMVVTYIGHELNWQPIEVQGVMFWGGLGGLVLWATIQRRGKKSE